MKKHFSRPKLGRKSKLIILIAVVLIAIFGVSTYLFAMKIDKDAQASLVASSDKVTDLTTGFNLKIADTTITANDKITLVKSYSSDLATQANQLCSQQKGQVYSSIISTLDRCERAELKLREVVKGIDTMHNYLSSEAALAALIPTGLSDLTFVQSYEAWSSALIAIEAVDTPSELNDQKVALIKAVTDYRDAWKALADADSAREETGFVAAQDILAKNHQALIASAQNTAGPLKAMSAKLATQLNAYFEESKAP